MERIRLLPRLWNGGLGETVEVRAELLLVGVGAVLLALVIGATARTYFDVFVRTLVLSFCLLAATLFVDDQIDRFAQELMGSPGTIGESFARFLILLIWATIAWGIARWVRRRRLARPGSSGAV
jgi:ABC-type uncharacterized transport system permease subunit